MGKREPDFVAYLEDTDFPPGKEIRCFTICSKEFLPKQRAFLQTRKGQLNRAKGRQAWKIVIREHDPEKEIC